MKTLEPALGEHITSAANRLIQFAIRSNATAEMIFNDIRLVASPSTSAADLCRAYEEETVRLVLAWRNSPAGQAETARQQEESERLQDACNTLVARLDSLDWSDLDAVIGWICDFQPASDCVWVRVPTTRISAAFSCHGFHANTNVGEAFDPEDRENVARYIVGQALDGLASVGAIHPILVQFARDWREKFCPAGHRRED